MFRLLAFLYFSLFVFIPAYAIEPTEEQKKCAHYLQSSVYEINDAFLQSRKPTFNPEAGSIEAQNPGFIAELIRLRMKILDLNKVFVPSYLLDLQPIPDLSQLQIELGLIKKELEQLVQKHSNDHRLASNVQPIYQKIDVLLKPWNSYAGSVRANLDHIRSRFWESIVACVFGGEQIYLGHTLSQVYVTEFTALNFTRVQLQKFDREIDIIIQRKDGTWRWIEVKDWGENSVQQSTNRRKLISQSHLQDQARQLLPKHKIQLELMLKYGPSLQDAQYFRKESAFDQIYFIFPAGRDVAELNPD